jgi:hypothetical protein
MLTKGKLDSSTNGERSRSTVYVATQSTTTKEKKGFESKKKLYENHSTIQQIREPNFQDF